MYVLGVDPSLTGTGVARVSGYGQIRTERIDTKGTNKDTAEYTNGRITLIANAVRERVTHTCSLAVMEGPARGQHMGKQWDRGGLWWAIYRAIRGQGVSVAVVPPDIRAYWATGFKRGPKADKIAVALNTARFWEGNDLSALTNDEVDALVLATMGGQRFGWPLADGWRRETLKRHEEAIKSSEWPRLGVDHG